MKNKKTVITVGSVLGGTFLGLICCAVVNLSTEQGGTDNALYENARPWK